MTEVAIWDVVAIADDRCMVILVDEKTDRFVAIGIGSVEARALVAGLRDITAQRPLSHDLMAHMVRELGGRLCGVMIERLVDHSFYAVLKVEQRDDIVQIDCRPSDAMCLAVRLQAPVYVANELLDSLLSKDGNNITLKKGDEVVTIDGSGIELLAARLLDESGLPS